jgi:hypothetical protein
MTDEEPYSYYNQPSQLTYRQEVVLVFLPLVPSLLSILCSVNIIVMVWRSKDVIDPYQRILFALSAVDVVYSTTFAIQPFLLPANTSQRPFAVGTQATCSLSGAMFQFGSTSQIIYFGVLSYYYLFTVRFGWRSRDFARWVEPPMHLVAVGWPLATAIAGSVVGVYDELDLDSGCWIDNYPRGCYDDCTDIDEPKGCYDDCTSGTMGWVAMGMWFVFVLISVVVNNVVIYVYVLRTTRRVSRQRLGSSYLGNRDSQIEKIRMVRTQALLYVASFLSSYAWTLMLQVMESGGYSRGHDGQKRYPLLLLQASIRPLAGCFNMIVYLRPRYSK